jgi:hypothetical protein
VDWCENQLVPKHVDSCDAASRPEASPHRILSDGGGKPHLRPRSPSENVVRLVVDYAPNTGVHMSRRLASVAEPPDRQPILLG